MDTLWIAGAGALIGAVGKVLVDWLLRTRKLNIDEAAKIRSELRAEILRLTQRIERQEREVEDWKQRCYKLREENNELVLKCQTMKQEINLLRQEVRRTREPLPEEPAKSH